ncbi:hypothetical protein [Methylocapsa acidiphila]|uniref:hypothetical protein n=1 Tax=Methylocapsa acidiphila TaxID=133552 RepID=UPI0004296602|nr:hypothetical protein [Methylocapsa acidiphila]
MTSTENCLDEVLKSLGLARFEPPPPKAGGFAHVFQVLDERARARLVELSEAYADPAAVEFGFAEHREFNAFAQRGAKDVICLYSASVRALWSFFNAVMTIREIFPWIDDVERLGESAAPPVKGELFFVRNQVSATGEFEPVRLRLARAMFDVATDFALIHAVGHLRNGHVAFLHQEVGPGPHQEMHPAGAAELGSVALQALEFDADSFAAQKVFARVHRENPFAEFEPGLLKDHRLPIDGAFTASWYFAWFAIYAYFRLFDEARAAAGVESGPQPPAALRQACLLSTVAAVGARQGWSSLSMPNWEVIATNAGLEAEGAICRLRRAPMDAKSYIAAWDGRAFDQIEAYMRAWESLGPRLAAFRKGGAPAQSEAPS